MAQASTLIAVLGPTASGKTSVGVRLAVRLGSEVLSADARQCYRELRIGVNRANEAELAGVPHHFLADRSLQNPLTAARFEQEGLGLLDALFRKNPVQLLVGGSTLYARAFTDGLDELPTTSAEVRALVARLTLEELQTQVSKADPDLFAKMDTKNPARLRRALEVYFETGEPLSGFQKGEAKPRPFRVIKIAPEWEREVLYERINARVLEMMDEGLLDEVKSLLAYQDMQPLQTVGYSELFDHLVGKTSLDEAIALIQRNTRRYARRQLTWLKKESGLHWFDPEDLPELERWIENQLSS